MALKTTKFDPAEYLDSEESLEAFLKDAYETGDNDEFLSALGIAARAKGMTEIAAKAGLT